MLNFIGNYNLKLESLVEIWVCMSQRSYKINVNRQAIFKLFFIMVEWNYHSRGPSDHLKSWNLSVRAYDQPKKEEI